MSPDRWREIDAALDAVLDAPPSERQRVMAQVCGSDGELRREIADLLAAHDAAGDFLETPAHEMLTGERTRRSGDETIAAAQRWRPASPAAASPSPHRPPTSTPRRAGRRRVTLFASGSILLILVFYLALRPAAEVPVPLEAEELLAVIDHHLDLPEERAPTVEEVLRLGAMAASGSDLRENVRVRLLAAAGHLALGLGEMAHADSLSYGAVIAAERSSGTDSLALASAYALRGRVLQESDEPMRAEPFYREAIALRAALLPPVHPDLASAMNNLGVLLQRERPEEASVLLERALQIRRTHFGEDDPYVANTLNNIACLHMERGERREAERALHQALAIYERRGLGDHPRVTHIRANIAALDGS